MLDHFVHEDKMSAMFNKMGTEEDCTALSYEEIIIRVQHDDGLKQRLYTAMRKLTPRQIELVHLKFFEGLSYEQIAEQTSQNIQISYNIIYDSIKILCKEVNHSLVSLRVRSFM